MSEEKTFRPERRPVSADMNPAEAQQQLLAAQNMRRMAEMDEMDGPPQPTMPQLPPGIIQGNIPPQFAAQLAGMQQPQQQRPSAMQRQRTMPMQSGPQIPADSKLADIIAAIRPAMNYEPVYLPSKGKFYDGEDGPQDGVIHLRPMTGQEEEILATPRFVKRGQAVNMIFNKCMQEKFDTEQFLTADRTYLLIYLRGISYSPKYEVEVKCPACDRKFPYTIDLNDLYVDQCPDDLSSELKDQLPTTKLEFKYRLSRGMDEQRVQDYRDRKMKGGFDNSTQADDTLLYRTTLLITEIAGLTEPQQIHQLLKELPISDVAHLRNVTSEPPFGVDTMVDIYCPSCLHDFTVDLPLEANFFFPRGKKGKRNT